MKGLIGRKVGMTQLFRPAGERVAVTVLQVGPCHVTQQKTVASDGYEALQLAFEPVIDDETARKLSPEQRERRLTKRVAKPQRRHFEQAGVAPHRVLREIAVESASETPVGTVLTAEMFAAGELVNVIGTTKGRGFQGAMARHNFSGQGASHGAKIHRKPASAGATDAARVFLGKRGPGQMGHARQTERNLRVELVDPEANLIAVRGAVPGPKGGLVLVLAEE
jgi:large subunit ribosomal protein L3